MSFPIVASSGYLLAAPKNIFTLFTVKKGLMSSEILWQICHSSEFNNSALTQSIVKMLQDQRITTKQAARDLNIPVERARNWYYRNTGMTAIDLLKMMQAYNFVRQAVQGSWYP
jgi:hypothetical protein